MNNFIEVIAIVEGKTEQDFIKNILSPYLSVRNIFITATQVSKPGSKGGDVKYSRVVNDNHLKQRSNTIVTTMLDLYGLKEWPKLQQIRSNRIYDNMLENLYTETNNALKGRFKEHEIEHRIIFYFSIYEFEALLFSDPELLAKGLSIKVDEINKILDKFNSPEKINNNPNSSPSKQLNRLTQDGNLKKISQGISIAKEIGIDKMRAKCPHFNLWVKQLENLTRNTTYL